MPCFVGISANHRLNISIIYRVSAVVWLNQLPCCKISFQEFAINFYPWKTGFLFKVVCVQDCRAEDRSLLMDHWADSDSTAHKHLHLVEYLGLSNCKCKHLVK